MDFMEIVREICATKSTDCRSLNKKDLARKLMDMANIPKSAEITEIPLDWSNQVAIMFILPNDDNYYCLYAGHWLNDTENMWLVITGKVIRKGNILEFNFFDSERKIDLDYFKRECEVDNMMKANEIANVWKEIVKIFNDTRETTPKTTVNAIIDKFGMEATKEVFATVAAIKKHDGRIYGKNRDYMNSIYTDPQITEWRSGNPIRYAGLDDIHTAHINQMITELRCMDKT